jgi:L-lactate dehydrogenase
MIKLRKIGIIGTGHVGSHVAFALATQGEVDELFLADCDKEKAYSQVMDINDAVSYLPHHVQAYAVDVESMHDCDIIVIAAGPLPEPYQSRLETLPQTIAVLNDILPRLQKIDFSGIIISISNPADVVAAYIQQKLQYPRHRILSTGTALDSARLQRLLAENVHISRRSFSAYMLGEHGDSCIVPWSHIRIGGTALDELQAKYPLRYPRFDREKMADNVHLGGSIVQAGKGSTEFGIASATVEIIRAVFHHEQKILSCSVLLNGEYNEYAVFASVPIVLGKNGIEDIIELTLSEQEQTGFHQSCEIIRDYIRQSGIVMSLHG